MSAENPQGYLHKPTDAENLNYEIIQLQNCIGDQRGQIFLRSRWLKVIESGETPHEDHEKADDLRAAIKKGEQLILVYQAQLDALLSQYKPEDSGVIPDADLPHWAD